MNALQSDWLPLVRAELQLRLRRLSTVVVLLTTLVLSWMIVADPRSGLAMMIINKARTAYESGTIAFGSAAISSMLLSLLGFYLVRGRSSLDLRSGCASVLAATPVSSARLLASRWLGALAYLMLLEVALILGSCVLQLIRGEGPLQPWVFVQTYGLMLTPALMLAAGFALLADSWGPLMGRRGDVAYFFVWVAQLSVMPAILVPGPSELSPVMALDISGVATGASRLATLMDTKSLALGAGRFDPSLPMHHFPDGLWSWALIALRLSSAAIALSVVLPALALFHRFDPVRVRTAATAQRASWWRRLLARGVAPGRWPAAALLRLSGRVGGHGGAWLADLSLTLVANPWALMAVAALAVAGQTVPTAKLPALLGLACALWGIAVADVASRDAQAGTTGLVAAAWGGDAGRFWRQWLSTWALGLCFALPVVLPAHQPMLVLTVVAGMTLASSVASLLGQTTRGGRSFLALFLFALYASTQVPDLPWLDLFGFNGSATLPSRVMSLLLAGLALGLASAWRRRE